MNFGDENSRTINIFTYHNKLLYLPLLNLSIKQNWGERINKEEKQSMWDSIIVPRQFFWCFNTFAFLKFYFGELKHLLSLNYPPFLLKGLSKNTFILVYKIIIKTLTTLFIQWYLTKKPLLSSVRFVLGRSGKFWSKALS